MWNYRWTDQPPISAGALLPLLFSALPTISASSSSTTGTNPPPPGALPTRRPQRRPPHPPPPLPPRPPRPQRRPRRVGRLHACSRAPKASRSGEPSPPLRGECRLARARLIDSSPAQVHLLPLFLKPFPSLGQSDSFLPYSSFPGGDDWASGGAICPVFAQPFAGDERILQVCPPLLFPSAVRDGAPQTLTKLFVFGSESSYNILPSNFDFVCLHHALLGI